MAKEQVTGGRDEQPGQVTHTSDGKPVPRSFVCAKDLPKKIRESVMYHVQDITDATKDYPGFCGDIRHLATGAPDPTIRLFYLDPNENEKRPAPQRWDYDVNNKGNPGRKYDSNEKYDKDIQTEAKEDSKNNKNDDYNQDKFMRLPGDSTNESGVFTNQCLGEIGHGQIERFTREKGDPKNEADTQPPQPEQIPQGIDTSRMPGEPTEAWKDSYIYLGGNPPSTFHVSVGGIKTNCAWPLVNTLPPASVVPERVEKGGCFALDASDGLPVNLYLEIWKTYGPGEIPLYLAPGFVWGTSHAYHEPYWRPDMWDTPLVNYFPSGDRADGADNKDGGNRVSWDMMTDHVARDADMLEHCNKKLWTTGGIHATGGVRPKHRYGELSLASSERKHDRKHLRTVHSSFKHQETSHFDEPPKNYRDDEKSLFKKMFNKVKKMIDKKYEEDLPKIREAERRKHGE